MGHSFVDHTADVAADLDGDTLGDLFASGAAALTDTITDLALVRPLVPDPPVTLEAPTLEDLFVDWLNELLYRFEARNMLSCETRVRVEQEEGGWRLEATVRGETFDPARHPYRVLVKSATYHGLHITSRGRIWRTRVVFDI